LTSISTSTTTFVSDSTITTAAQPDEVDINTVALHSALTINLGG
jgi:hypothetical protein